MTPLVSILIPCYNAEATLAATVESALAQTWPNKELVIVSDGSTDDTLKVAYGFARPGVLVVEQPNRGASAARNTAYEACKGDFIQFLDADDLLSPDKIEKQVRHLEQHADCVATCQWARFYTDPEEARFDPDDPTWRDFEPTELLRLFFAENRMMHPAAWLVPRAIAEAAGPWDERLSLDDDGEYFCRVMLASRGVRFVPGARTYYRSGLVGSLSHLSSQRGWESQLLATSLCTEALLARDNSPEAQRACADRFQRFVHAAYPSVSALRRKAEMRVGELGGSDVRPDAGPMLRPFARLFGWKAAARVRRLVYRLGYQKLGYWRRKRATGG